MDLGYGMAMGTALGLDPSEALLGTTILNSYKSISEDTSAKTSKKEYKSVKGVSGKRCKNKKIKYQGKTINTDDVYDYPEMFI